MLFSAETTRLLAVADHVVVVLAVGVAVAVCGPAWTILFVVHTLPDRAKPAGLPAVGGHPLPVNVIFSAIAIPIPFITLCLVDVPVCAGVSVFTESTGLLAAPFSCGVVLSTQTVSVFLKLLTLIP